MSIRDGRSRSLVALSLQMLLLGLLLFAWQYVTVAGWVSRWLLPHPDQVAEQLYRVLVTGTILPDLALTVYELVTAFMIAAVLGILIGYAVGTSRYLTQSFEPVFAGVFAIPIVVFYPLCILYFGLGPDSKIVFGALHGFFPIVLSTIAGLVSVDRRLLEAARSMGASDGQIIRLVLLPAAFPIVLSGLRIGVTLTFLAIIGGETLGALNGLGHKIVWAAEAMDTALMYAYIVLVVVMAAVLYFGVAQLEPRRRTA